jgi:hypothetical protein
MDTGTGFHVAVFIPGEASDVEIGMGRRKNGGIFDHHPRDLDLGDDSREGE